MVQKSMYPIGSMYGIFTYIYHKNQPNVGKYTIHGSYGYKTLKIMVDKLAIYQLVIAGFQASTTYEDDKLPSE